VFQIKEQLEAIGDTVEEDELVMTTLNVLALGVVLRLLEGQSQYPFEYK
jgi:hypothetical protein